MSSANVLPALPGAPHSFMNRSAVPQRTHVIASQASLPAVQGGEASRSRGTPDLVDISRSSPFDDLGGPPPAARPTAGVRVTEGRKLPPTPTIPDYFDPIKASMTNNRADSSSIFRSPAVAPQKRKADDHVPRAGTSTFHSGGPRRTTDGVGRLRPFLEAAVLHGTRPRDLFDDLVRDEDTGRAKVQLNAEDLHEVIWKLSEHASPSYLQLMADEEDYTEVISLWLRRFKKDPERYANSIAPLFSMLSRTNMPVNYIDDYAINTMVKDIMAQCVRLGEGALPSLQTIRAAYNRYMNYYLKVLVPKNRRVLDSDSEDDKPIIKKVKPTPKPAAKLDIKFEKKKPESARKTDQSFFGGPSTSATAPKPRPRTPLDAKPSVPAAPKPTSLLGSTLAKLKNQGQASSSAFVPRENKPDIPTASVKPKGPKLNKKGHSVRWVDTAPASSSGRLMEAVRFFREESWEHERPFWQDGEGEDGLHGLTAHQLDMQEGRALHHFDDDREGLEEQIDWAEPNEYLIENWNPDAPHPPRHTPEVAEQDERERSVLATAYLMNDIPPSADESAVRISRDDATTKRLYRPSDLGGPSAPPPTAATTPAPAGPAVPDISSLLSNLSNIPTLSAATGAAHPHGQEYSSAPRPGQNRWGAAATRPPPPPASYTYQNQNQPASQPGYSGYGQYGAPGYTPNHTGAGYSSSGQYANGSGSHDYDYSRPGGNSHDHSRERGGGPVKGRKKCFHWLNKGACPRGDRCHFAHTM